MAETLLREFGSAKNLLEAREEQLCRIHGIGPGTATTIRLILPFVRRWERMNMIRTDYILNTREAERYCKSLLMGFRAEQLYVICLNAGCQITGQRKVTDGSLSEVNAYPRVIVEIALNYNAHSVLLCHNHPGGTNHPSCVDIQSTMTIQRLLKGIGIGLLDHIIVAGAETYSMIEHQDIPYLD